MKTKILFLGGVNFHDVCFILHEYIPARAAAWSYHSLGEPVVQIDSLWGLPDGLQFLPHDSFEIDVYRRKILSERIRFKSQILHEQEDGSWIYVNVKRSLGRHRSLSEEALFDIAERTRAIAENIKSDAQIMWFCDIPRDVGLGVHLPWFRAREHVDYTPIRPPHVKVVMVARPEDLTFLRHTHATNIIMQIIPDANLIRDEDFLDDIIDFAKDSDIPVELAGSLLGHAYYKFKKAELTVYSADASTYSRVRGRKIFRKLVRDHIPETIASRGEYVRRARLTRDEAILGLVSKLFEEALELANSIGTDEIKEEVADVHEVLRAICAEVNIDWEDVVKAAELKRELRGGFESGVILLETSLPQPSRKASDDHYERGVSLEEIGHPTVGDGFAEVSFARLLARSAPPVLEVPVGDEVISITVRLEAGSIVITISTEGTAALSSSQLQLDLLP